MQDNIGLNKYGSGFTTKSLVIGVLLIPLNCYWIVLGESVYASYTPSALALFANVVFILFIFVLFNLVAKRLPKSIRFTQAELLTIYVMLCMGTAITGHGFAQILPPIMTHAFRFATPENEWHELFFNYLPNWLTISDKNALDGYYAGNTTFYTTENIRAWLIPVMWWSAFIFAFISILLCINIIIRKQWTEKDKLAYPIIQLPLSIAKDNSSPSLMKSRLLWIGFAIPAIIDLVNGLNYLNPTVPYIPVKMRDIGHLFSEKPWSAIGWTPISFYPSIIGLAFFIPLDLSFSAWFFYIFYKLQRVIGSVIGLNTLPGFPDNDSQSSGAYLALFFIALWGTRKHLRNVFISLIKPNSELGDYDINEPLSYRTTMIVLF